MAAKPEDLPNGVPASAAYPGGSGVDESVPGISDDGTPLTELVYNDIQGFLQGLLSNENILASGTADTVLVSQYREGLSRLTARGGDPFDILDTETAPLGMILNPDNSGGAITINLPTVGLYADAVVKFTGNPAVAYLTNPVTYDAGSAVIGLGASPAQTVEVNSDGYIGGFKRNSDNTRWLPFKDVALGTREL